MTNKEIFKIWAPKNAKWIDWVRPVPFVGIKENSNIYELGKFDIPNINYINEPIDSLAVIVDLDANESIKEGIGLARIGFRPIPIFNGTHEQNGAIATVNNHAIEFGLIKGAFELQKIKLKNDAPPAFLLDSNRMNRFKINPTIFDNSWDIYYQDIPSEEYFIKNNINKIIIVGNEARKDLKIILYKFQKKGIKIFLSNRYETPKEIHIKKPKNKDIDI